MTATPLSVLIIDADQVHTGSLLTLLSSSTSDITFSSNSQRGLRLFQDAIAAGTPYTLLLVDRDLAGVGQANLLDEIHDLNEKSNNSATKVIALLSLPLGTLCHEQMAELADGELCKPVTIETLSKASGALGITMRKLNCWEFKRCGRQPGGSNVHDLGECPAACTSATNGLNDGRCGGRVCWAVSGTLCGGQAQGSFAKKIPACLDCDFYKIVAAEQGDRVESINTILTLLKKSPASGDK